MPPVCTYPSVMSHKRCSVADRQPDLLEFLQIAIAGLGHRTAQTTDKIQRAERVIGRTVEDLVQGQPLAGRDLQQGTARKRRVGSGGRPEPALALRLDGLGERGAKYHRVGAAGD